MQLIDAHSTFNEDMDGLILSSSQQIAGEHMDRLRAAKDASLDPLKSELNRVASVPTIVVERWMREGFNIYKEPARAILARLRNEGLDGFITTKRRI